MGDEVSRPCEKLISEPVKPLFEDGADDYPIRAGEPVVPRALEWRGVRYPVLKVTAAGKELGSCSHGSGERYLDRHWYRIETTGSLVLRVYFERRPRKRGAGARRWWLYTTEVVETVHK